MSTELVTGDALVPYTFATWVFMLHVNGVVAGDAAVSEACAAIIAATDESVGNEAGEALVRALEERLGGVTPENLMSASQALYGVRAAATLGQGSRRDRVARIRKYQFERQLPWLARIWERTEEGDVRPSWLLVERVTDVVRAADPNPWNDIDEERLVPVDDFQVLWELDGCTSVHLA